VAAYGLSRFTEFAGWLAILLVAYAQGGPMLAGVSAFVMQLPAIVLVPILAGVADRRPRGAALTLSHVAVTATAALTALLLLAGAPLWVVLVGGAAMTLAVCLVRPMHFATLPILARGPGDLVAANGWSSFMDGGAIFIGFVLAGLLTDHVGAWAVLALSAVLSLGGVLLSLGIRIPAVAVRDGDGASEMRAALEGFWVLRRSSGALALLLLMACPSVMMGSNETLSVTFNDEVLGLSESTAGLVAGAFGVGIAIGGIAVAGLARRRALTPVVLAGALLLGIAQAAVASAGALLVAVALLFLVGVGMALIVVSARTLLQRSIDDGVLAKVLAVQEGVHLTGLTVGAILGPLAIAALGSRGAFVPFGAVVIVIGLLSHRSIRALDGSAVIHEREVDLLSRVPFLAALPPYELERLSQGARWERVPAGTVVVAQGEPADSYYLVASGELSVSTDGLLREHTMGPGGGFGEIALLNRTTRTATITSLVECELLVVSSDAFLAAVTSTSDGEGLAHEVSRARLALDRLVQPQ
jgi:MFS family permease